MTFPSSPVSVPDVAAKVAAHRPVSAVWVNELGGVTFAIDSGAFEASLLEAYGVLPDNERMAYYRRAWD